MAAAAALESGIGSDGRAQGSGIGIPPGCWSRTMGSPALLDRIRAACREVNRSKESLEIARIACDEAQDRRTSLFMSELLPLFDQKCGTHEGSVFLQNVLSIVNEEGDKHGQKLLVTQMQGQVVTIAMSPYANYFLQACINSLPIAAITFVINELLEDTTLQVAKNQQGVRVLQRLIEQCCCANSPDPDVNEAIGVLFHRIIANTRALACHKFGQYILSAMCENGRGRWSVEVIAKLLTLQPSNDGIDGLLCVASHHYGCWVVQSALAFRPETDEECGKVIQLRSRLLDLDPDTCGSLNKSRLKRKDKYSWISKIFRKQWTCCNYEDGGSQFLVHNKSNETICINPRCRKPNSNSNGYK